MKNELRFCRSDSLAAAHEDISSRGSEGGSRSLCLQTRVTRGANEPLFSLIKQLIIMSSANGRLTPGSRGLTDDVRQSIACR